MILLRIYIFILYRFDFLKLNKFSYHTISFDNGIIESKVKDNNGNYEAINKIERIIILGYKEPKNINIIDPSGERVLDYTYDNINNVLTIRKPECLIVEEWKITIN